LCLSGDVNQPAGVSPSCVSHHFVSVTHIREERKPFWVSSADFISTFFPLLLLLILWLRKNKNTRKNRQQCRRRPSSAFYNISSSGFIFVGSVGRVIVCLIS
jgi:hypothetical protein